MDGREQSAATLAPGMAHVESLDQLVELVDVLGTAYVRFSAGPAVDADEVSRDGESGAVLPGLSVNRLAPEPWWNLPVRVWVARQLVQYAHLGRPDGRLPWVLTGTEVGRGPDSEPLLAQVTPVATVAGRVLDEAEVVYREVLAPGRLPDER
ncbi:DUF6098 family protein [Cellulomonas sp. URHB0016]